MPNLFPIHWVVAGICLMGVLLLVRYHWMGKTLQAQEKEIRELKAQLEQNNLQRVEITKELEVLTYSVSHDLRAPLRAIGGFSQILLDEHQSKLSSEGQRLLDVIRKNADKMSQLLDDLLQLSRISQKSLEWQRIPMQELAQAVIEEQRASCGTRSVEFVIRDLLPADGDPAMIRQVLVHLVSNALKFSRHKEKTMIEMGSQREEDRVVYYVKDNGEGFDMQYVDKLFRVFQRLHSEKEFEGTGVGLALVRRIIQKHGGRVWADARMGEGATFYFTLPERKNARPA